MRRGCMGCEGGADMNVCDMRYVFMTVCACVVNVLTPM